jgi:hypothetical protein
MKTIKNLIALWKLYRTLQKISNSGYEHAKISIYYKDIWIGPATKNCYGFLYCTELDTLIKLDI